MILLRIVFFLFKLFLLSIVAFPMWIAIIFAGLFCNDKVKDFVFNVYEQMLMSTFRI